MPSYSVAVIIPCYNCSKYIQRTIDSALNQDYEHLEIIAIDDGSTDDTKKILEGYFPKIRIMSHPNNANCGAAASLNLGINATKSELIAFLDSDDIWHPNKIRKQLNIFQKYSDVGLIYTNGYVINEIGDILYKLLPNNFQKNNISHEILLRCYIRTPSSVIIKKEIFKKIGLFKTYLLHNYDHDMWIRMGENTKFYYIPDYLISYRRRLDQMSLKRRQWEEGFITLRESCKRYPYGLNVKRKRLAVLYYRLGEYDWGHHGYFRALKNYFFATILDPFRAMNVIQSKIRVKKEL